MPEASGVFINHSYLADSANITEVKWKQKHL